MVQKEVAVAHGWRTEVYIKSDDGRRGYIDIYDDRKNEFYEVKSRGAAGKAAALADQLIKYLKAIFIKNTNNQSHPSKGTCRNIHGIFTYGKYKVEYSYSAPGLIVYDVSDSELPQYEYAYEPAENRQTTQQPGWNTAPIPVPIFFWPSFGGSGGGGGAPWNVLHPQMT